MTQSLSVDTDGLRAHGAAFQDIGAQAQHTVAQLQAVMEQEGACWGADAPGEAFAKDYQPDAQQAMQSLHSIAQALSSFGNQMSGSANNYDAQDQANATQIQSAPDQTTAQPPQSDTSAPTSTTGPAQSAYAPSNSATTQPQSPAATSATSPTTSSTRPAASSAAGQPANVTAPGSAGQPNGSSAAQPNSPVGADNSAAGEGNADPAGSAARAGKNAAARSAAGAESPATKQAPTTATPWRAVSAPSAGRRSGTPWAKPTGAQSPSAPRTPGPADEHDEHGPGRGGQRARDDRKQRERRNQAVAAQPEHPLILLARQLADRHHLDVLGFDTSGIDEPTVQEFAAAIDETLTAYQTIDIQLIAIAELADDEIVRTHRNRSTTAAGQHISTVSITLNIELARDPRRLAEMFYKATRCATVVPGSDIRPVYSETVRELGRALDFASGSTAQAQVKRALIAEYLKAGGAAARHETLGTVVHGYRRWRNQLSGRSFHHGRFEPDEALADAFTDVVLNQNHAAAPAHALHRLLVESAHHHHATTPPFEGTSA